MAPAQAAEEFYDAVTMGQGGAGRGLASGVAGLGINPAALMHSPRYLVSAGYFHSGRLASHGFHVGAVDTRTSNLMIGLNYVFENMRVPFDSSQLYWRESNPAEEVVDQRRLQRWDIGVGYALANRRINIAATARILNNRYLLAEDLTRFTLDVGATFWPLRMLSIGISAQNLVPTRFAGMEQRFPTRFGGGIGFFVGRVFSADVDVVVDFGTLPEEDTIDMRGGLAVTIVPIATSLRAGYSSARHFTDNYVHWGVSLDTDRVRIAYSMKIEVGPMNKQLREDRTLDQNRITNIIGVDILIQ